MRLSGIALCLPLAVPALAASQSAKIHLNYLSPEAARDLLLSRPLPRSELATEFERTTNSPAAHASGVASALGTGSRILPKGIQALAVDPQEHSLSVVGDEEAIEQVKRIVRLVDVPARRLRLELQVFRFQPDVALPVKTIAAVEHAGIPLRISDGPLSAEQVRQLEQAASTRSPRWILDTGQAETVHLFAPEADPGGRGPVELSPRVRGDGMIAFQFHGGSFGASIPSRVWDSVRVFSNSTNLLIPRAGEVWLVRAGVLPDVAPAGN